jgi:hypothetical protein
MLAEVQLSHLLEVIWVSTAASIFSVVIFSFVVLGSARSADARRAGKRGTAILFGGLAVVAFIAFAASVVFGVNSMLAKG